MRYLLVTLLTLCIGCTEENPAYRGIDMGTDNIARQPPDAGFDTPALSDSASDTKGMPGAGGAGGPAEAGVWGPDTALDSTSTICPGCWKDGRCVNGENDPSGMACGTGGGTCLECPIICFPGSGCTGGVMGIRSMCQAGKCNIGKYDADRAQRFCCAACQGMQTSQAWPLCQGGTPL